MLKKLAFYLLATLFIFCGQFLSGGGLVTGKPPALTAPTLDGGEAASRIRQGPALLYFWASWCGVCRAMQNNVDAALHDHPGLTIAERSGDDAQLTAYLRNNHLTWPTVNDNGGTIGQNFGVRGVPAIFIVAADGNIVFASAGYTSEFGLRVRLWLAKLLF